MDNDVIRGRRLTNAESMSMLISEPHIIDNKIIEEAVRPYLRVKTDSRKVGKRVGNNLYIHISATNTLTNEEISLVYQKICLELNYFDYNILKINTKENKVSFINSLDWDIVSEPEVGDCYSVNEKNEIKFIKSKGQIYHHKWQFVQEDYEYFDVAESKRWSETWQNSDVVKQLKIKDKNYLCKIGYKDYFDREIKNKILTEEERR